MPEFFDSTAAFPMKTRQSLYAKGGRVGLKAGGNDKWIQEATASIKARGTKGVCTGKKFGSKTCPPGSKRYNLAKTFKKMARKRG